MNIESFSLMVLSRSRELYSHSYDFSHMNVEDLECMFDRYSEGESIDDILKNIIEEHYPDKVIGV